MREINYLVDSLGIPIENVEQEKVELMSEASAKDIEGIFTMILFEGCDLSEVLHCTHMATKESDQEVIDKMISIIESELPNMKQEMLEFAEPGVLGKKGQKVLFLTKGEPYRDLLEKLQGVAKYSYESYRPHVSVTTNVESLSLKANAYVISLNGVEVARWKISEE